MKTILTALLAAGSLASAAAVIPTQDLLIEHSRQATSSDERNTLVNLASEAPTLLSGGIGLVALLVRRKRTGRKPE